MQHIHARVGLIATESGAAFLEFTPSGSGDISITVRVSTVEHEETRDQKVKTGNREVCLSFARDKPLHYRCEVFAGVNCHA